MLKIVGLKVVGHRGARGLAPENTVAALHKGLAHNVVELEVDVRVTKDGLVVLHHDAVLRGDSEARLPIRKHSYADLVQHKTNLPTLEEAIRAVDRKVPIQIEVKSGEPTEPIVQILRKFLTDGWSATDFLIGSKKQQTLRDIRRALPDVPIVVIESFSGLRATWRARQLGTKRLSMRSWWLWGGFIRVMYSNGYELYAYTVDNPVKIARWHRFGLTGVITDRPDLFQ